MAKKRKKTKRRRSNYQPCVYIVGFAGFVKIGTTQNPVGRFQEFQVATPYTLYVHAIFPIVRGRVHLETRFHTRYAEYRERGEWFRVEGDLRRFLKMVPPRPCLSLQDWLKRPKSLNIQPDSLRLSL